MNPHFDALRAYLEVERAEAARLRALAAEQRAGAARWREYERRERARTEQNR